MSRSCEHAGNSVEHATSAANSFDAIAGAVEKINDMSMMIASAVEEQGTVAEEINRGITVIRDTAETNMQGSKKTEEASTVMASLAHGLKDLADEFWAKNSSR
jgi:methyl-accepting chemotaxis protein